MAAVCKAVGANLVDRVLLAATPNYRWIIKRYSDRRLVGALTGLC